MDSYKFRRMPWFAEHSSPDVGIPTFPPQEQQASNSTQSDQLPVRPDNITEETHQPEQLETVEANSGFVFLVMGLCRLGLIRA